jgi:hypothetical protein
VSDNISEQVRSLHITGLREDRGPFAGDPETFVSEFNSLPLLSVRLFYAVYAFCAFLLAHGRVGIRQ